MSYTEKIDVLEPLIEILMEHEKKLVRRIAAGFKIPYYTITPTFRNRHYV